MKLNTFVISDQLKILNYDPLAGQKRLLLVLYGGMTGMTLMIIPNGSKISDSIYYIYLINLILHKS